MSIHRAKLLLIALLALLSLAYLGRGFYVALTAPDASDLGRRWVEQRYVMRSQNPYDVAFPDGAKGRDATIDPAVGVPSDVDYPPWAYFSGFLFFWPPWRFARPWYAFVNALALVYIVQSLFHSTRGRPLADRWLAVVSVTAAGAFCTTVGSGNYGAIVLALLLGAYRAEEDGRPIVAGLLLGLALLKPNLSGLFLLVPLVRGRWRVLGSALVYLAVACGAIWAITKTDPIEMTGQMVGAARRFVPAGAGPLNLAIGLGVPYKRAVPLVALGCAGLFFGLMRQGRGRDLLFLYALAAVGSRLWTYHLNHSNLILAFLLLALWREATAAGGRVAWLLLLAVGLSLWVPATLSDRLAVQVAEHLAWAVGLAGLWLLSQRPDERSPAARVETVTEPSPSR